MDSLTNNISRREAVKRTVTGLGFGLIAMNSKAADMNRSADEISPGLLQKGAKTLRDLAKRLAAAPRRRDFKTVPMILTSSDQWDNEALNEVMHYAGGPKQVWDNTDLESPWLNLMRNAMNAQIWSFHHPDFLTVSATHGSAHTALYDDYIWQKYDFSKLTKDKQKTNSFIVAPPQANANPEDFNNPEGPFSPHDNSITVLQKRGAVFLACHNAVWELSMKLHAKGPNPDNLTHSRDIFDRLLIGLIAAPFRRVCP